MINYKIERVLFIFIWIGLIYTFSLAIPPQNITPLIQYQYATSTLILTILIFYIYHKVRNRKIKIKIERYLTSNEFELCDIYIQKCINRQPRISWLRFQKLMLIALKGEITEFKAFSAVVKKDKNVYKKGNIEIIKKFEFLFDFMVDKSIGCVINNNAENSYLDRTVYLICNRDGLSSSEIVSNALILYNAPYNLYKSIAASFLATAYTDLNDKNNANLYSAKAKEYAPSNEMIYCIRNISNDKKME